MINASAIIADGSVDEVGFLNERTQRIHDNDYYQYFSYSLNSQVQYEDWNPLVSDLNHTSGFRKFSDLSSNPKMMNSPELLHHKVQVILSQSTICQV